MIEFLKGKVTPKDWAVNAGIIVFTGLLCIAFVLLVVLPTQRKLHATKSAIEETKASLQRAKETDENIEQLRKEKEKMQRLVDTFEKRLPTTQEIGSLLRTLESFGAEMNLRVALSSMEPKVDLRKETIPYRVQAWGNFHQLVGYINKLERYQRYFKISDLVIKEQQEGVSEASFILSTYRFKLEEEEDQEEDTEKS